MLVEFFINNHYTDQETKDILKNLKDNHCIDSVLIDANYLRLAKYFFDTKKINLYVDYPLGNMSTKLRLEQIKANTNSSGIVSIQAPSYALVNRKYDKIRKEIESIKNNVDKDINIRYIIDYRKFNHNILCKFCSILEEFELDTIYASTGFFVDNVYDHILAIQYLTKKSKIKCILNANIWTKDHVDLIMSTDIAGLSVQHLHVLSMINTCNDSRK
jgi:deoxyribose-phosphate aldolase